MLTLAAVKGYCHIDGEDEDELVLDLIASAKEYLSGAGVDEESFFLPLPPDSLL